MDLSDAAAARSLAAIFIDIQGGTRGSLMPWISSVDGQTDLLRESV